MATASKVNVTNSSNPTDRGSSLLLLALALAKVMIQFAGINHYGFFRDEFYYVACGEHLAWGYVDQPPLVALVAWFARHTLGDSMFAIRLLPVLAGAAVVYVTGRIGRELGAGLFGQFLAAGSILLAPAYLAFDSFFSMNAFEPLIWALCAWIVILIVNGGSQKLWLLFGGIAGVGLENKHTMLVFGFALVASLLLTRQWKQFTSRSIWLGGAMALAIFLPNLLWEAMHGWPQIEVVRNGEAFKILHISAFEFLWEQVLFMQPVALPVWLGGLYWYFFTANGRKFRFLGWAFLIVLAVFIALDGKSYYVLPVYPVLMAAGGVMIEQFLGAPKRYWVRVSYAAILIVVGLVTLPFGVPLLPVATFLKYSNALPYGKSVKAERDAPVELPQLYADMFGWDNLGRAVANVYYSLPANERANCAIIAGNYGEAGAIDYYGGKLGLPKPISGHNSHYDWGTRGYSGQCVILVGERSQDLSKLFGEATLVAKVSSRYATLAEQNVPIYICRKPSAPLAELWPHFRMVI